MIKKNLTFCFALFLTMFLFATANAQDNSNKEKPKDRPLKILTKYNASSDGQCNQSSGTAELLVTFDQSDKVTDVVLESSSGCKYFDKNAIATAKKIKFQHAIKDGEAITVTKKIHYMFKMI